MILPAVWSTPACQLGWTVFPSKNYCDGIQSSSWPDLTSTYEALVLYVRFVFLSKYKENCQEWDALFGIWKWIWQWKEDQLAQAGKPSIPWVTVDVISHPLFLPWCALLASCRLLSWCSAWAPCRPRAVAVRGARGFPAAAVLPEALVAPEFVPAAPAHSVEFVWPHQTAPCWKNAASPEIANHTTSDYSPHPLKTTLIIHSRQQDLYIFNHNL